MKLITAVQNYIESQALLTDRGKVLVALSGGPDSVALSDVLQQLGYELEALHVNFHLRGEESFRDEAFVRDFCMEKSIPLTIEHLYAEVYAKEKGCSIEMAARTLRYTWFEQMLCEKKAQAIALGHHRDDAIETFFLNLLRGAGVRGLTGIRPHNGHIVRPLLCVSRQAILNYLQARNLSYITDSSNLSCVYKRNLVRLRLLPLLEEIDVSARRQIARSMRYLQEAELIYNKECKEALNRLCTERDGVQRMSVSALEKELAPESILFTWLETYAFDRDLVEKIWENRHAEPGKTYYSRHYRLLLDRDVWLLQALVPRDEQSYEISMDTAEIKEPLPLLFSRKDPVAYVLDKSSSCAALDAEKLSFPLILRRPRQGDSFRPFGMHGQRKLLSDYCTDRKMSLIERQNLWVLESAGEIVWLVGERMNDRFRITPETKHIFEMRMQ